jgi:hypothetical protein
MGEITDVFVFRNKNVRKLRIVNLCSAVNLAMSYILDRDGASQIFKNTRFSILAKKLCHRSGHFLHVAIGFH